MENFLNELLEKFSAAHKTVFDWYDGIVEGVFALEIEGHQHYFYTVLAYFQPDQRLRMYCVIPIKEKDHDSIVDQMRVDSFEEAAEATRKMRNLHSGDAILVFCRGADIRATGICTINYQSIVDRLSGDVLDITLPENTSFWEKWIRDSKNESKFGSL